MKTELIDPGRCKHWSGLLCSSFMLVPLPLLTYLWALGPLLSWYRTIALGTMVPELWQIWELFEARPKTSNSRGQEVCSVLFTTILGDKKFGEWRNNGTTIFTFEFVCHSVIHIFIGYLCCFSCTYSTCDNSLYDFEKYLKYLDLFFSEHND